MLVCVNEISLTCCLLVCVKWDQLGLMCMNGIEVFDCDQFCKEINYRQEGEAS